MKLLLLGATGLVGSKALKLALSNDAFSQVIAPTRKPLAPSNKLLNPVSPRLEDLAEGLMPHRPDAVLCALGTTQAKAGSKAAFRYVDYELPMAYGKAAHAAGVETYAVVTAMGASPNASSFYYRTKGEVEKDIQQIGFQSLTICRPSLIGGKRNEARYAERGAVSLIQLLAPVLPKKFHANSADAIAAKLLDAIVLSKKGCHWIYSEEMA
jgi:uncharacterized protein YbjT (DUF2867 family)